VSSGKTLSLINACLSVCPFTVAVPFTVAYAFFCESAETEWSVKPTVATTATPRKRKATALIKRLPPLTSFSVEVSTLSFFLMRVHGLLNQGQFSVRNYLEAGYAHLEPKTSLFWGLGHRTFIKGFLRMRE
jgi:hypothetical protein